MIKCCCCNNSNPSKIIDMDQNYLECSFCGHIQFINRDKDSNYYQRLSGRNAQPNTDPETKVTERVSWLYKILGHNIRVLEVGCTEGHLGDLIKKKFNVHYVGIEPSLDRGKAAKCLDHVFPTINSYLKSESSAPFSLILSFHLLEHISNPLKEVLSWKKLCNKNTKLVIETPNQSGLTSLPLDRHPEHLHQFTLTSLVILLQRAGFSILKANSGYFESKAYPDCVRVLAHVRRTAEEKKDAIIQRFNTIFPNGFSVYGIGGDFRNYLLPVLNLLPKDMLKSLHDSNSNLWGKYPSDGFTQMMVTPLERIDNPILISSFRFSTSIQKQLINQGIPEDQIFELSDMFVSEKISVTNIAAKS